VDSIDEEADFGENIREIQDCLREIKETKKALNLEMLSVIK